MNYFKIKISSIAVSLCFLFSALSSINPIFYSNWNLYYTGSGTGNHLSQTYYPPRHDHYRVSCTGINSNGSRICKTKVTCNGVNKGEFTGGGAFLTIDYVGTARPSIGFSLSSTSGTGPASMSGTIEYYDN